MDLNMFLASQLGNNTVYEYMIALLIVIGVVLGLAIISFFVKAYFKFIQKKYGKNTLVGKIFSALGWPLFLVIGLKFTSLVLNHSDTSLKVINYALSLVIVFYSVKILSNVIRYTYLKIIERKKTEDDKFDSAAQEIYSTLFIILLWFIAFIYSLSLFNLNIYSIITGLGLFSVAIGFAMQNVLSDLFATISIYFDKPFGKGDFIVVGTDMGTVDRIGVKSTRIKTLQGEELVVSNRELTETRVRNFRNMDRRRVVFTVGVTYDTSLEKLKEIPKIIENILNKMDSADFSRAHFKEFGDSSLIFEGVYFIKSKEYGLYMDTHQQFNLELLKEFRKKSIVIAFPTRTLWINEEKSVKKNVRSETRKKSGVKKVKK